MTVSRTLPIAGLAFLSLTGLQQGPALPRQFDIQCSGPSVFTENGQATTTAQTRRLSINIDRRAWCEGRCSETKRILASDRSRVDLHEHYGMTQTLYHYRRSRNELWEKYTVHGIAGETPSVREYTGRCVEVAYTGLQLR